jgi:hypothetical protein
MLVSNKKKIIIQRLESLVAMCWKPHVAFENNIQIENESKE